MKKLDLLWPGRKMTACSAVLLAGAAVCGIVGLAGGASGWYAAAAALASLAGAVFLLLLALVAVELSQDRRRYLASVRARKTACRVVGGFECQNCGARFARSAARCPACGVTFARPETRN